MTSVPHSGEKSVTPGGSVAGVTPFTPGHLYFDDPTWDQKIALKGRKTVYGQPYVVAHVNRPGSARSDDDKRYARLFCAAPDLLDALKMALTFLDNAVLESGICCCGDPISTHNPYHSNHAPIDDLAYHSDQVAASIRAAISKATAGETRNAEPIHRRDGDST